MDSDTVENQSAGFRKKTQENWFGPIILVPQKLIGWN
jgi:hypothetical protein